MIINLINYGNYGVNCLKIRQTVDCLKQFYCALRDGLEVVAKEERFSLRVMRLCGSMRMTPPLGLSISAIKKKDTDVTKGKIINSPTLFLNLRAPNPTRIFAHKAIAVINAHAGNGMR